MLKNAFIYALFLLVGFQVVHAQKLVFRKWGVSQGLPATEVYNLFQDKKGYVWAFTEYGIVRHNGVAFVQVCKNLSFQESAVYAVTESPSGQLHFANSKGMIYEVWNDSAFQIPGMQAIADQIVSDNQVISNLSIDEMGTIYCSTLLKTYLIHRQMHQRSSRNRVANGMAGPFHLVKWTTASHECYAKIRDRTGQLFYTYPGRIAYYQRLSVRNKGQKLYICLGDQMVWVNNNHIERSRRFDHNIISFEIAPNGHVWVGCSYDGLYELDAALNVVRHYLGNTAVSDILFDDNSGMWVSTIGEGIYYCKNTCYLSYANIPELRGSITLLKQIKGRLFIGTSVGQLFVKEQAVLREIDLGNKTNYINSLVDFEKGYYVGTKGVMLRLDSRLRQVRQFQSAILAYTFVKKNDHDLVIVSASVLLTKHWNESIRKCKTVYPKLKCVVYRSDHELLIGTVLGLYRWNQKRSAPASLQMLKGANISNMTKDRQGAIWICTKGNGLYRLLTDNRLITCSNLPSRVINDIRFIRDTIVVMCTNKGVYVNSERKLNEKHSWIRLLNEETLSTEEYDNQLFIATKSGLMTIEIPRLFDRTNFHLYWTSVRVNGRLQPAEKNLRLSHRQNDLYFNFDLLVYGLPDKGLCYHLDGPSPSQGVVNGTQVHLQNLSPGEYVLYAYPDTHLINWQKRIVRLTFYIRPAFWQTTFFFVLMVILFVAFTSTVTWIIVHGIKEREARKTTIEKLLAEYQLTALKAQINPHFMSNSLVAIQQLILTDQADSANQYIAKFSLLIRYLLNYSDKSVISLFNEWKIIDLYVELEQLRFSNRFVFIREIDDAINMHDVFIPALITQPLIENAIWHGLLPLAGQRIPELTLKIALEEQCLVITIGDNGVGRTVLSETPQADSDHESKGTLLIRKRIEHLNRLYGTSNGRMEFIDVTDEQGHPTGSVVRLIFPSEMLNQLYDERNQERHH